MKYTHKNMSVDDRNYNRYLRAMRSAGRIFHKSIHSKKLIQVYFTRLCRALNYSKILPKDKLISLKHFIK